MHQVQYVTAVKQMVTAGQQFIASTWHHSYKALPCTTQQLHHKSSEVNILRYMYVYSLTQHQRNTSDRARFYNSGTGRKWGKKRALSKTKQNDGRDLKQP